jgi:ribose transport system substrate-binding protein
VSSSSRARPLASLFAVMLVVALSMFVMACGEDEEAGGGGSAQNGQEQPAEGAQADAKAFIEENKKIPEFKLDAEPFDVTKAKGKTLFNIPVASTIPYVAAVDREMQKVAEEQGVEFIQYENEGSPTQWAAGINQGINRNVDLIVLQAGNDPQLVVPQLRRAKEAGIPVLVSHLYQNGTEPPEGVQDLITAYVTVPFWEAARLSVDYAVSEDGCEVKPVIITAQEVPPSNGIVDAMKKRLKERCPDSEDPKVINAPVTEWGTKIRPEVQSAVQSDPNVNWILPIYDSMSLGAEAGIRAAGKADQVRIASYNGTPEILKLIQDGDIMAANQGENINWLGWANMDQAFRILADGPIIKDGNENTPLRVFDDSNIDEVGSPPEPGKGYGDAYITGYRELWGLEGGSE